MSVLDRLKKIIGDPNLADDGSRELAKAWVENIEDAKHLDSLMENPAFKNILEGLRSEFRDRMLELVAKDPELSAMRHVFIRLIGLDKTENRIEEYIDAIMDSDG